MPGTKLVFSESSTCSGSLSHGRGGMTSPPPSHHVPSHCSTNVHENSLSLPSNLHLTPSWAQTFTWACARIPNLIWHWGGSGRAALWPWGKGEGERARQEQMHPRVHWGKFDLHPAPVPDFQTKVAPACLAVPDQRSQASSLNVSSGHSTTWVDSFGSALPSLQYQALQYDPGTQLLTKPQQQPGYRAPPVLPGTAHLLVQEVTERTHWPTPGHCGQEQVPDSGRCQLPDGTRWIILPWYLGHGAQCTHTPESFLDTLLGR